MDTNSSLMGGGIVATVVLVGGAIYKAINHKHLRSKCNGQTLDVSIDIGDTTPATTVASLPDTKLTVRKMSITVPPSTPCLLYTSDAADE